MTDVPPEVGERLSEGGFSSGLSIKDMAACLHMGMEPVALVQGYCVLQWSYYSSAAYGPGGYGRVGYGRSRWGSTLSSYSCPHYYGFGAYPMDHATWGENFSQRWVRDQWEQGWNAAYSRMVAEARAAGADGIIGVVDRTSYLADTTLREFHIYGTAVRFPPLRQSGVWTSYLAGQRLAKLLDSGFMPVSVVATMASVRVWAVCVTEILMSGAGTMWTTIQGEVPQVADAQMQCRRLARDQIRSALGPDVLHGARLDAGFREVAGGDYEAHAVLRGTRVSRHRPADPLPPPRVTVRLS